MTVLSHHTAETSDELRIIEQLGGSFTDEKQPGPQTIRSESWN